MTREIKIRVWDNQQKKFIYSGTEYELLVISISNENINPLVKSQLGYFPDVFMGRFIYQQFTGLKDKDGVDIYEGDIMQSNFSENIKYEVCYYVDGFKVRTLNDKAIKNFEGGYNLQRTPYKINYRDWAKCKIIGNIYENPELIQTP